MPATAAGLTELILLLSSATHFQHALQRPDDGLFAHAFAIPREAARFAPDGVVAARPREAHHPHRLRCAAAGRSGDSGHGHRYVAAAALERAARHLAGGLFADRTAAFKRFSPHPEQLLLRVVRVGDEAALEPVGGSRYRGHGLRHPAAGAGFGGDEDPPAALEALADLKGKRLQVVQRRNLFAAASTSSA